jgi:hypothetical protein
MKLYAETKINNINGFIATPGTVCLADDNGDVIAITTGYYDFKYESLYVYRFYNGKWQGSWERETNFPVEEALEAREKVLQMLDIQFPYPWGELKIKDDYELVILNENMDSGCNNGNYPEWKLIDKRSGNIVESGITCGCGRGCSNTDCIRDDYGTRDTCIEQYRTINYK